MAKRSYLAGYSDKAKADMPHKLPDVSRAERDQSPEAQDARRVLGAVLQAPSLDNLYSRYKRDDDFAGPITEYPAEMAARAEANEAKWADPVFAAAIKRAAINRRKNKGYDIDDLKRRKMMGEGRFTEDEQIALDLLESVDKAVKDEKDFEKFIAKLEQELKKELEEEESMRTSFDRNTRKLYSPLRIQNIKADKQGQIDKLRKNLETMKGITAERKRERDYFMDVRPKTSTGDRPTKGTSAEKYKGWQTDHSAASPKKRAILVKKKKEEEPKEEPKEEKTEDKA